MELSLSISMKGGASPSSGWVKTSPGGTLAAVDLDFEKSLFWINNSVYSSLSSLQAAGLYDSSTAKVSYVLTTFPSTYLYEVTMGASSPSGAEIICDIGDTSSQLIRVLRNASGNAQLFVNTNTTSQFQTGAFNQVLANDSRRKIAVRSKTNDPALSVQTQGAGLPLKDTLYANPLSPGGIFIGRGFDQGSPWPGTIHRITIFLSDESDANLATLVNS